MDPYAGSYAEFFEAHPEYLTEVIYHPLPERDEPQLCMRPHAMEAFIVWAAAQGYLRHPEYVPDILQWIRELREL
jgi:hypothetical protein